MKEKLNALCEAFKTAKFTSSDFAYLQEYMNVMSPIAHTIDFLQGEKEMLFGFLSPAISSLCTKLCTVKEQCRFLKNVTEDLVESLKKRFSYIFNEDDFMKDTVLASTLHPNIKLKWLSGLTSHGSNLTVEIVKLFLKAEIDKMIENGEIEINSTPRTVSNNNFDTFFGFDPDESTTSQISNRSLDLESEIASFLSENTLLNEMSQRFPILWKAFIKFNTALPTSAPVERMFSFASLVNSPKRNRLSDENFEIFVLLKANQIHLN